MSLINKLFNAVGEVINEAEGSKSAHSNTSNAAKYVTIGESDTAEEHVKKALSQAFSHAENTCAQYLNRSMTEEELIVGKAACGLLCLILTKVAPDNYTEMGGLPLNIMGRAAGIHAYRVLFSALNDDSFAAVVTPDRKGEFEKIHHYLFSEGQVVNPGIELAMGLNNESGEEDGVIWETSFLRALIIYCRFFLYELIGMNEPGLWYTSNLKDSSPHACVLQQLPDIGLYLYLAMDFKFVWFDDYMLQHNGH